MTKHELYKVWTDGSVTIVLGDGTSVGFNSVDEAGWSGFVAADANLVVIKLDSFRRIEGSQAIKRIENRGI